MKRLSVRLSIVGVVLVLGAFAIYQAQRGSAAPEQAAPEAGDLAEKQENVDKSLKPLQVSDNDPPTAKTLADSKTDKSSLAERFGDPLGAVVRGNDNSVDETQQARAETSSGQPATEPAVRFTSGSATPAADPYSSTATASYEAESQESGSSRTPANAAAEAADSSNAQPPADTLGQPEPAPAHGSSPPASNGYGGSSYGGSSYGGGGGYNASLDGDAAGNSSPAASSPAAPPYGAGGYDSNAAAELAPRTYSIGDGAPPDPSEPVDGDAAEGAESSEPDRPAAAPAYGAISTGPQSVTPQTDAAPDTTDSSATAAAQSSQATPSAPVGDATAGDAAAASTALPDETATAEGEANPLAASEPSTAPPAAPPAARTASSSTGSRAAIGDGVRPPSSSANTPQPIAGADQPGARELEGQQAPSLVVEKTAPAEIQVNRPATFQTVIRNVGQVAAHEVTVLDAVPQGTELLEALPQCERAGKTLVWQLGTLQPGEEVVIAMELMPLAEGNIGSVARVAFEAAASISVPCTKPVLAIKHTGPAQVLIGELVTYDITVTNNGTGAATGVVLEENVPQGLRHERGSELEYEIGTLRPGETRHLQLQLEAAQAGSVQNTMLVRGEGDLMAEDSSTLTVTAPVLQISLEGPKKRYLEREAKYQITVANPGTAAARNIELVTFLPRGLEFVSTDHQGQYDPAQHAVYWSLQELPPDQMGAVQLTVLPVETGEHKLRAEAKADLNLNAVREDVVLVDALAELQFTVADLADPVEVGSETAYEIRVTNSGSKDGTNVQVVAQLPAGLEPLEGSGTSAAAIEGQQVLFQPLSRLAPGEVARFKIRARGRDAGDHRLRVQLISDELNAPITKEEGTRVYADR